MSNEEEKKSASEFFICKFQDLAKHKLKFLDEPPEKFVCDSCLTITPDMFIPFCGHLLCSDCFKPPKKSGVTLKEMNTDSRPSRCPLENDDDFPNNDEVQTVRVDWGDIKNLRVFCPFSVHGCLVSESLQKICNHMASCSRRLVPCLYCYEEIAWAEGHVHILEKCPKRPATCRDCSHVLRFEDLKGHEEICPQKPVTCCYCKTENIPRCELEVHEEECEDKPRSCKMHLIGCVDQYVRAELREHEILEDHVDLLMNFIKTTNEKYENDIKMLKEECAALKDQLTKLTQEQKKNTNAEDDDSRSEADSKLSKPHPISLSSQVKQTAKNSTSKRKYAEASETSSNSTGRTDYPDHDLKKKQPKRSSTPSSSEHSKGEKTNVTELGDKTLLKQREAVEKQNKAPVIQTRTPLLAIVESLKEQSFKNPLKNEINKTEAKTSEKNKKAPDFLDLSEDSKSCDKILLNQNEPVDKQTETSVIKISTPVSVNEETIKVISFKTTSMNEDGKKTKEAQKFPHQSSDIIIDGEDQIRKGSPTKYTKTYRSSHAKDPKLQTDKGILNTSAGSGQSGANSCQRDEKFDNDIIFDQESTASEVSTRDKLGHSSNNRVTSYLWKLHPYSTLKETTAQQNQPLYSNHIFTKHPGYKIRLLCYLNGNKGAEGKFLSLYLQILQGQYDHKLNWPFPHLVELLVESENDESKTIKETIDVTKANLISNCFGRPNTLENSPCGKSKFISHSKLEDPENGYLTGDILRIRANVLRSCNEMKK